MVGEPGCSFHLQSLGASFGVHLQPTPPPGLPAWARATPTFREEEAWLPWAHTDPCYSKGHTGILIFNNKIQRTHSGPIQRLTHAYTHRHPHAHTHLHTSTHTEVQVVILAYGAAAWINIPAKTSELSCSLQRPEGELESELSPGMRTRWVTLGSSPTPSLSMPVDFPRSTKMPQRRPLSWGGEDKGACSH